MELHLAILKTFEYTVAKLLGTHHNVQGDKMFDLINDSISRLEARIRVLEQEKKKVWYNDIVELKEETNAQAVAPINEDLHLTCCDTTPQGHILDENEPDIVDYDEYNRSELANKIVVEQRLHQELSNLDEKVEKESKDIEEKKENAAESEEEGGVEGEEEEEEEEEEEGKEEGEGEEEGEEEEEEEGDGEGPELEEIKYNGKIYYKDTEGFCYMLNSDGELDEEPVGVWSLKKSLIKFYKRS
jgi:cobalamin biosynthesis protein CobT